MWRTLWTRFSRRHSRNTDTQRSDSIVQPLRILELSSTAASKTIPPDVAFVPRQIHRQRVLAMELAHTKLCSPTRCKRLAEAGVITCEDLCRADVIRLAKTFRASRRALAMLNLYRRSIRLAAAIDDLSPVDAMALVSVHRRTVASLAQQSAAMLHRDLDRFAQSSTGRMLFRGRRLPSTKRIAAWIQQAKSTVSPTNHPVRIAG
jgi:Domain of unknown function (DUF4332)